MAFNRLSKPRYEIIEWRDRRYQRLRDFYGDESGAKREVERLNEGFSGPKYSYRKVAR